MDVATSIYCRLTHCHFGSARELYLYHRSYREVTFGIWVSETVDFTSLRTPGPINRTFYGWRGWGFYIAVYGVDHRYYMHNFPSYRSPGVRSEVKLTQLVASVVEK